MSIPQYSQVANAQTLAAQQTLATQQKQASMFRGGADVGFTAPNMGGNNPATQQLANDLTQRMANQQTQAINDQRIMGGKRITKRKHYTKQW